FDTKHMGIVQGKKIKALNRRKGHAPFKAMDDYQRGRFILDTREPGNSNKGHLFDNQEPGKPKKIVIGPKLSEEDKMALIEYLKTI
ncbi:MAG: hypothetical protein D3925_03120, partial [Candidatus Electrothrix sp. AR5]|nr:hypothetical protein [Candidatus Electrothrix sp. AR5]